MWNDLGGGWSLFWLSNRTWPAEKEGKGAPMRYYEGPLIRMTDRGGEEFIAAQQRSLLPRPTKQKPSGKEALMISDCDAVCFCQDQQGVCMLDHVGSSVWVP
jgi:hypothetical protein